MLSEKISEAHATIAQALDTIDGTPKFPRLMSSFGKDSLVMTHLLEQHGVRDVLWLADVDEVIDYGFIASIVSQYNLCVTALSRGRAFFLVLGDQPLFLAYTFLNKHHMTPFPTNIVPWKGSGTFTCVDEELRAPRGYALHVDTDLIFTGFKLADVTAKNCLTALNLLPDADLTAYLAGLGAKGPHNEIAPGLPSCSPLLTWSDQDVWEYLHAYKIPTSTRVYDVKGKRIPTEMRWCYRCHDPNAPSLVQCPKSAGRMIPNFAALTNESHFVLDQLREMGVLTAAQVEKLHA